MTNDFPGCLYHVYAERHLPVFCHTRLTSPDRPLTPSFYRVKLGGPLLVEVIAVTLPDLKIMLCHPSYPFTEQATYMLYAHARCVYGRRRRELDSGTGRVSPPSIKAVFLMMGTDKILFGWDKMNVPQMMKAAVIKISDAPFLTDTDKRKILGDNARK